MDERVHRHRSAPPRFLQLLVLGDPALEAKSLGDPTATLELLSYETQSGWHTDIRIVVANVGEAKMTDVTAEVRDVDGNVFGESLQSLWPRMPMPALYKNQDVHLKFDHFEMPTPASIVLRWRDGRQEMQQREIWLSYRRV